MDVHQSIVATCYLWVLDWVAFLAFNRLLSEMLMHDGMEVGHYMGNNMKWHTSVPSCICISVVISLGTGKRVVL